MESGSSVMEAASSSTVSNFNERPKYLHEERVSLITSWAINNPGRRFYQCPHWKVKEADCGFFEWIDPEVHSREKDTICSLLKKKSEVEELLMELTEKRKEMELLANKRKKAKGKFKEEMEFLRSEVVSLRKENKVLKIELLKHLRREKLVKLCCMSIVSVLVLFWPLRLGTKSHLYLV